MDDRRIAFFDVDGTLIDHNDQAIDFGITQLKARKGAGYAIAVWSAGGPSWGQRAVSLLGLTDYVDYILDKPTVCFDDLPPEVWANWWDVTKQPK